MAQSTRRYLVVGRPFYRVGDEMHFDVDTISEGDVVMVTGKPDEDGDVTVRAVERESYLPSGEPVSPDCLVEIDGAGYPVLDADLGETPELLAALYPIAVVVLRGAL